MQVDRYNGNKKPRETLNTLDTVDKSEEDIGEVILTQITNPDHKVAIPIVVISQLYFSGGNI